MAGDDDMMFSDSDSCEITGTRQSTLPISSHRFWPVALIADDTIPVARWISTDPQGECYRLLQQYGAAPQSVKQVLGVITVCWCITTAREWSAAHELFLQSRAKSNDGDAGVFLEYQVRGTHWLQKAASFDVNMDLLLRQQLGLSVAHKLSVWGPLARSIRDADSSVVLVFGLHDKCLRLRSPLPAPSAKYVRSVLASQPSQIARPSKVEKTTQAAPKNLKPRFASMKRWDPFQLVAYIKASSNVENVRDLASTVDNCIKARYPSLIPLLQKHQAEAVAVPGYDVLRRARVLLDLTCMLMTQDMMAEYFAGGCLFMWSYLMCDGSPASGFEAFACVEQLYFFSAGECGAQVNAYVLPRLRLHALAG